MGKVIHLAESDRFSKAQMCRPLLSEKDNRSGKVCKLEFKALGSSPMSTPVGEGGVPEGNSGLPVDHGCREQAVELLGQAAGLLSSLGEREARIGWLIEDCRDLLSGLASI